MATVDIFEDLAKSLIRIYVPSSPLISVVVDALLNQDELKDALKRFDAERLFGDLLVGKTKVTPDLLKDIVTKIKDIQKNTRLLVPDGVLGKNTLGWLIDKPFACFDPRPGELKISKTVSNPDLHAIRYFIVDNIFPKVDGLNAAQTEFVFEEALDSWQRICNFVRKRSPVIEEANVVVSVESLNLGSDVLGVGDIGPPGKNQLRLRFEKNRHFTASVFLATAAHEFGHCLGIRHEDMSGPGALMNPRLQDGILEPKAQDIAAAKLKWGEKPPA